ncbi:hypothetical protein DPMN_117606 [Dreissena polymorpha]|uniref:Uncharacterized protein n=1 Tax=Dreissena polymorpha TaxID=45954 RepID=A0A9D4GG09_DREPO|nr:hypothetical protein DPMN_117606 [Dreissena polymorpha]
MKSAKALPRYGSGHKSAGRTGGRTDGRTDGQPDGRTDNAKTISLRLWRGITGVKNAPHHWKPYIIETNLLTKFHEDWTINVASREKFPVPDGHDFKATKTIFELIQDIIGTNLQTKFHDDRIINVTSTVLTSGHAFLPIRTIFELNCHIQKRHVLTKFHEHWTKNVTSRKTAPPPGGHIFSPIWTIFELFQ